MKRSTQDFVLALAFIVALTVLFYPACSSCGRAEAQTKTVSVCWKWRWKKGGMKYGPGLCVGDRLPDGGFED